MLGLMQNQPLLTSSLIDFAERHHGDAEIVSRRVEGEVHRYNYAALAKRARQVANALDGFHVDSIPDGRGSNTQGQESGFQAH